MIGDDTPTDTREQTDDRLRALSLDDGASSGNEPADVDRYTVFQQRRRGLNVGEFGIILPAGLVYEIIESANIRPMPGVTALFKGFINHRGTVAPVYDLAELFQNPDVSWDRRRVIIINKGAEAVAIKIYDLPVPVRNEYSVPPAFIENVPAVFRQHVQQACRTNDRLWLELDFDAFFETLSRLCLDAEYKDCN